MAVEMVESFPLRERCDSRRKTETEEEIWEKAFRDFRKERPEIQKSGKCQYAGKREIIFVLSVEIELERRDCESHENDVRVGSASEHVEKYAYNCKVRENRSGIRPHGTKFPELAESRQSVENGHGF